SGCDLEAELPDAFRIVTRPSDVLRQMPGDRWPEFSLDLARDEKPSQPGINGEQPVGVNRSPVLPLFLKWTGRQFLDDARKEFLVETYLCGSKHNGACHVKSQKTVHRTQERSSAIHCRHPSR